MQSTAKRLRTIALAGIIAAAWLAAYPAFAADPSPTVAASAPAATVNVAAASPAPTTSPATTPITSKAGTGAKVTYSDAKCTKFVLSGTVPNQTLICQ